MTIRVEPRRLGPNLDTVGFLVDMAMILLVIINLSWIFFDWLFAREWFSTWLEQQAPEFHLAYASTLHENFFYYDLMFVAVYLAEFMVRWIVEAARGTYHRWWFFPVLRWYDLIGCIPIGGFRWLRLLRVFSLLYRLQRMGVIDLSDTAAGRFLRKYYAVLVEEVSDRVVINVLEGIQREIREDNPLTHDIERKVLAPRREPLVDYLAERLISVAGETQRNYREPLGAYLASVTDKALRRTPSGRRLAAVPGAGPRTMALLRDTVKELGVALSDQLVEDLENPANRSTVDQLLDDLLRRLGGEREQLDGLVRDTLLEVLDEVKAHVAIQRWKLGEQP